MVEEAGTAVDSTAAADHKLAPEGDQPSAQSGAGSLLHCKIHSNANFRMTLFPCVFRLGPQAVMHMLHFNAWTILSQFTTCHGYI